MQIEGVHVYDHREAQAGKSFISTKKQRLVGGVNGPAWMARWSRHDKPSELVRESGGNSPGGRAGRSCGVNRLMNARAPKATLTGELSVTSIHGIVTRPTILPVYGLEPMERYIALDNANTSKSQDPPETHCNMRSCF